MEGTALRPQFIAELDRQEILAVGLYAEEAFLRKRMESESLYSQQDANRRLLIDKFITRTLRDNESIVEAANRFGLRLVNVSNTELEQLAEELIGTLALGPQP